MALVIDDDDGVVVAAAVVAELDLPVAQVDGGFVAARKETKPVVLFDLSGGLGVEEFVVVFGGGCAGPNCSRTFAELWLYEISAVALKFSELFRTLEQGISGVRLKINGKSEVMPLRGFAKFRR